MKLYPIRCIISIYAYVHFVSEKNPLMWPSIVALRSIKYTIYTWIFYHHKYMYMLNVFWRKEFIINIIIVKCFY